MNEYHNPKVGVCGIFDHSHPQERYRQGILLKILLGQNWKSSLLGDFICLESHAQPQALSSHPGQALPKEMPEEAKYCPYVPHICTTFL